VARHLRSRLVVRLASAAIPMPAHMVSRVRYFLKVPAA